MMPSSPLGHARCASSPDGVQQGGDSTLRGGSSDPAPAPVERGHGPSPGAGGARAVRAGGPLRHRRAAGQRDRHERPRPRRYADRGARPRAGGGLRVEISDGSAAAPALRHHSSMAGTGRGLRLLQAMVESWGTELRALGQDRLVRARRRRAGGLRSAHRPAGRRDRGPHPRRRRDRPRRAAQRAAAAARRLAPARRDPAARVPPGQPGQRRPGRRGGRPGGADGARRGQRGDRAALRAPARPRSRRRRRPADGRLQRAVRLQPPGGAAGAPRRAAQLPGPRRDPGRRPRPVRGRCPAHPADPARDPGVPALDLRRGAPSGRWVATPRRGASRSRSPRSRAPRSGGRSPR